MLRNRQPADHPYQMMQKTATNDYTYIVASAETNQVAEDFVAALSDENAASFDENIFKGNHPSFDGFITIDVSAADENADVYTLSVTHPAGKVAVAVAVRVERAAAGKQPPLVIERIFVGHDKDVLYAQLRFAAAHRGDRRVARIAKRRICTDFFVHSYIVTQKGLLNQLICVIL